MLQWSYSQLDAILQHHVLKKFEIDNTVLVIRVSACIFK